MKPIHRLFKRGNIYYAEDTRTGRQESLKTEDRLEAQRLLAARNEAANNSELTLALGRAYLNAIDPDMLTRTWADVMAAMSKRGIESTRQRCERALRSQSLDRIRCQVIMETTSSDFLGVLSDGKQSTRHYLKLLHSFALDLGWRVKPVLTRKCWPTIQVRTRRAIKWDEHCRIIAAEKNQERRLYYEVLWETGASQTDAAKFNRDNVDQESRMLVYGRQKTGQQAGVTMGQRFEQLLKQLPQRGPFFPKLSGLSSIARAAEFYRRCRILGIEGVSLHSYRYAWAERAFRAGYPERYAQAALGHGSRAIHHAYARKAKVTCPALEEYEKRIVHPAQ